MTGDPLKLHGELDRKQRNVLWPDTLEGGASVDRLLLRGGEHLSSIQRAGIVVFGIFFLSLCTLFCYMADKEREFVELLVAVLFAVVSCKVLSNFLPSRIKARVFGPAAALLALACLISYLAWPLLIG